MTLNQLRHFRVLAKTEHYTKAADALDISQPSLSRAIALLEEELRVLLSMVQAGLGLFISTDHPQMLYSPDTVLVPLKQERYRLHGHPARPCSQHCRRPAHPVQPAPRHPGAGPPAPFRRRKRRVMGGRARMLKENVCSDSLIFSKSEMKDCRHFNLYKKLTASLLPAASAPRADLCIRRCTGCASRRRRGQGRAPSQ